MSKRSGSRVRPSMSLFAGLLGAATTCVALNDAQIASVFGATATNLTAAKTTLPRFEFTVVTNATHALVSLNSTSAPSQVGWMATGTGTAMANADFLITWPNPAGASSPWTISHRRPGAGGEVMPFPAAMPSSAQGTRNYYTLLPDLSSTSDSSFTAVTYLRMLEYPSDYPNTVQYNKIDRARQPFIYASSSRGPGDADEAAQLMEHDQPKGTTTLDLSQPLQLAVSGASSSGSATASAGGSAPTSVAGSGDDSSVSGSSSTARSKRDMYIIAHAVLASLAVMLFFPLGIVMARFLRGFAWYPLHAGFNILGAAMIIAAFGLGIYVTGDDHFQDTHQRVGLALFIIVVIQVVLGFVAHNRKFIVDPNAKLPTLSNKGPIRYGHILIGLAVIGLGWYNVHEGFDEWESSSDAQSMVPRAVEIVYWILVGVFGALYVGGWVVELIGGNRPKGQKYADNKKTEY
ncbi:hypothetical protein OIO90_001523 [Microbotryomycetes sp. JL221]|nr:hypothetical protein OIO90_001523 [Microbotryomycetes sp. JL221]